MTTISLETAQQLQQVAREKNYKLPLSQYYYVKWIEPTVNTWDLLEVKHVNPNEHSNFTQAYTIDELLKEISWEYVLYKTPQNLWNTFNRMTEVHLSCPFSDSPQEALAQLLIYLIENNKKS
jgi:hypothetical protein